MGGPARGAGGRERGEEGGGREKMREREREGRESEKQREREKNRNKKPRLSESIRAATITTKLPPLFQRKKEKKQQPKTPRGMSTAGEEVPAFFKSMGSDSPARPRQKFCGMFCPVEGSSDSKTLDFDALSACRGGRSDGRVIDRQTDITQPRKVEIRESTGKEALQNLDDKRVSLLD